MLDGIARKIVAGPLAFLARRLQPAIGADAMSGIGLCLGLLAAALVALHQPIAGLASLVLSRIADGLDGAIARINGASDRGGYIDIVFDFAVYGAFPLGFAFADPASNGLPAALLLCSFYINGASFLAFATFAAKRGLVTRARGPKSLYFTSGLAEGSETIVVFAAMCVWPNAFALLAYAFAVLCIVTLASRVALAWRTFT